MIDTYPPELQSFIKDELTLGHYQNENELLVNAVKVLQELSARHQSLRDDVMQAVHEADRGELRELDIEEVISKCQSKLPVR
jgi:Arc/MetJ-type ribon-helix-helix transcriptional regulator